MLIVIAMLVIPLSLVMTAMVVDYSAWQSERRGAQKDADLAALAGALELAKPQQGDADAAARASLVANDEAGNGGSKASNIKTLAVAHDCPWDKNPNGPPDAVTVELDHTSRTFFSQIFTKLGVPEIGARAKACAGAAQSPQVIVPIETHLTGPCFDQVTHDPLIAKPCPLDFGSDKNNPRGILDLEASGDYCSEASSSGDMGPLIENGATGTCLINQQGSCNPPKNGPWYDCVAVQNGNKTDVARAFRNRIAKEGQCDATYGNPADGTDDFLETVALVPGTTDFYEPRDCDPNTDGLQMSPRLVTIIVLPDAPVSGNDGYPIYAFAGMYVTGCNGDPDNPPATSNKCPVPGNGNAEIAPVGGGTHFASLSMAPADCGNGAKKTPCPTETPTDTPVPTNTPLPDTPTRTPTNTSTPGPPTDTPTPKQNGNCGQGNQPTCVPTPTPGGPTATPTPDNGGNGNGHIVVWGRFVNLIFAGAEAGPPTSATTIFSISLTQ